MKHCIIYETNHIFVLLVRQCFIYNTKIQKEVQMSKGKNQHVTKHGENWQVLGAGNSKATKVVSTQGEAITIAKEIAINQNSELVVHGRNGRIREKDSFGNDPRNIKG